MERHAIYVVHTPLHLLFALAIIEKRDEPATIWIVNDYASAQRVYEEVPKFKNVRVELLAGSFSWWGKFAGRVNMLPVPFRWAGKLLNHVRLIQLTLRGKKLLQQHGVSNLYIFNDARADIQALMQSAKRLGAEITYVEDGLGAYLNVNSVSQMVKRYEWLSRLIYGASYQMVASQGEHSLIQSAIILHPAWANNSLSRYTNIRPMPPFSLYHAAGRLGDIFAKGSLDFDEGREYSLVCIPHSEVLINDANVKLLVSKIIEFCQSRGLTVLVKFHPREKSFTKFNLQDWPGIQIVDQNVPAELVVAVLGVRLVALYSSLSSVLLTSSWIASGTRNYQIGALENQPNLQNLFQAQGVKFIINSADVDL